jgi:hypothetical protein
MFSNESEVDGFAQFFGAKLIKPEPNFANKTSTALS